MRLHRLIPTAAALTGLLVLSACSPSGEADSTATATDTVTETATATSTGTVTTEERPP